MSITAANCPSPADATLKAGASATPLRAPAAPPRSPGSST
jgi:hypothetical protein